MGIHRPHAISVMLPTQGSPHRAQPGEECRMNTRTIAIAALVVAVIVLLILVL
jgi:hypothetical protein